ncbi:MAG: DUF2281 domain-containing protein [Oscillospiraceae bacterium]|nr:DUF2281 domain-containing protein [Oscillospiraceae bacterium]
MQVYEGYFENGSFHPIGNVLSIPEHKRVIVTILDEPVIQADKTLPVRPPFEYNSMSGKIWMADDFDEPLDDFSEYM